MNSQTQRTVGWVIVILGIVALAAPKMRSQSGTDSTEKFQKVFSIATGGTLEVDNYKGTIHVTGSDTNQVSVDVTKRFEGNDTDRKWWMEHVEVNFRNDANHVAVEVKYPQWSCVFCWADHGSYTAAVELEIHVPRQINVKLESYKPDIRIAAVQGDIRVKSYKSPIELDSTTGAVRIDTYKETVKLKNVTVRGPLEVKSYKADAEINARALGESATLESDKGSIVLRVPQNTGLDVDYEGGRHSSFRSDFALTSTSGRFATSYRGTINQGGTRLRLRTEKGTVSLEKLAGEI